MMQAAEFDTFAHRQLLFLLLGGVFERFPRLSFVMTEQGAAWVPPLLRQLDELLAAARNHGALGELPIDRDSILPRSATEYFHQNVHLGVSQPTHADLDTCAELGTDFFMWGSDYPHSEGTYPFTREHLRQVFHGVPETELRKLLAGNAARVYDYDLDKLAGLAAQYGPRPTEIAQPLAQLPDEPNEVLLRNATPATTGSAGH